MKITRNKDGFYFKPMLIRRNNYHKKGTTERMLCSLQVLWLWWSFNIHLKKESNE